MSELLFPCATRKEIPRLDAGRGLWLAVRLKGPAGNPDGLGAVVKLRYADGFGPAREIHGGSGYLSQDSPVPVLGMRGSVTHVSVRWPGGKTAEVPVRAGAREVVVEFAQ